MGDSRGSMRSVGILVVTAFVLVCTAETSRADLDGAITMEELTQSARERQELAEFTEKLSASAAVGEAQSVASSAALEAQGTSAGSKDPADVKQAIKLIEKNPHQAFKLVKDLKRKLKTKTIELAKMQVAAQSFKKKKRTKQSAQKQSAQKQSAQKQSAQKQSEPITSKSPKMDKTAITSQKRTKAGTGRRCPWQKLVGLKDRMICMDGSSCSSKPDPKWVSRTFTAARFWKHYHERPEWYCCNAGGRGGRAQCPKGRIMCPSSNSRHRAQLCEKQAKCKKPRGCPHAVTPPFWESTAAKPRPLFTCESSCGDKTPGHSGYRCKRSNNGCRVVYADPKRTKLVSTVQKKRNASLVMVGWNPSQRKSNCTNGAIPNWSGLIG